MDVSCHTHDTAALHPEKEPRYPLDRRLCGPQWRSGRDGEENKSLPSRESNPGYPICSVVTILNELSQLSILYVRSKQKKSSPTVK